jgi:nucleotide-binding universal stress UspA family protein
MPGTCASADAGRLAVVATAFDAELPALVSTAVSLARRLDLRLRFVHALEPLPIDPWVLDGYGYDIAPLLLQERQAELSRQRQAQLAALLSEIPDDVSATACLVTGEPARAVVADAVAHRARLIITACDPDRGHRLALGGCASALTLMAEAPLPVLVVSGTRALTLDERAPCLLVADDLQHGTREAARRAFELASLLSPCRVHHVHVRQDVRDLVRRAWADLVQHHALGTRDRGPAASPEELWAREQEERLERLRQHGQPWRQRAESRGVEVLAEVRAGGVAEEVHAAAADVDPDLLVFGRHRLLRLKPFLIGRMPLYAMLEDRRPLLVVPPLEEIYYGAEPLLMHPERR